MLRILVQSLFQYLSQHCPISVSNFSNFDLFTLEVLRLEVESFSVVPPGPSQTELRAEWPGRS